MLRRYKARLEAPMLPKDAHKVAHFCSMCGPKFCSMEITAAGARLRCKVERDAGDGGEVA